MEAKLETERLKSMIVCGEIENKDGYNSTFRFQNVGGEKAKLAHDLGRFGVDNQNLFMDEPNLTALIFVPLDTFAETSIVNNPGLANKLGIKKSFMGISKPWDKGLTAMAYQINVAKIDPVRSGQIGGTLIFKNEDAQKIQEQIQNDPRVLYDLIRVANGGPIMQYNGPVVPNTSESITIFPNDKFGGPKKDKTQTAKFPQGYNPNSLM